MKASALQTVQNYIKKTYECSNKLDMRMQTLAQVATNCLDIADGIDVTCGFMPGDGLCFCIDLDDGCVPHVIPVETFFKVANETRPMTIDDFKQNSI